MSTLTAPAPVDMLRAARRRAIVRVRDGRVGVLVFWPPRGDVHRGARVLFDGPRSQPVAPGDVVEVLAIATRPSARRSAAVAGSTSALGPAPSSSEVGPTRTAEGPAHTKPQLMGASWPQPPPGGPPAVPT